MVAFKKILFPTDFLASETSALSHAMHLAALHQGELLVQHVVNDDFERYPHCAMTTDAGEMQKHMEVAADSEMKRLVAPLAGDVPVRQILSKGMAAREICALAEQEAVDLIVIGSTTGAVTSKIIHMATQPVLAFPPTPKSDASEKPFQAQRILVATDFSEHSRQVVRYAFELREASAASLFLLYVMETPRAIEFAVTHGQFAHAIEKMKEWALNELQLLIPEEFVNDPGVVRLVERGSPSHHIANVARNIDAGLIILGTHRHGSAYTHLLGTTTDRLLTNLDRPLLMLKL